MLSGISVWKSSQWHKKLLLIWQQHVWKYSATHIMVFFSIWHFYEKSHRHDAWKRAIEKEQEGMHQSNCEAYVWVCAVLYVVWPMVEMYRLWTCSTIQLDCCHIVKLFHRKIQFICQWYHCSIWNYGKCIREETRNGYEEKKGMELINVYYVLRYFFTSWPDAHFVYSKVAFDFLFSSILFKILLASAALSKYRLHPVWMIALWCIENMRIMKRVYQIFVLVEQKIGFVCLEVVSICVFVKNGLRSKTRKRKIQVSFGWFNRHIDGFLPEFKPWR